MSQHPAIELVGIDKKFGSVHANKNINLKVRKGTIHGIVGENGAGKSTLMSILFGFYKADSGDIRVDGQPVTIKDSQDAIRAGIGMVHQHFMLVDNFTVLENVMLGAERGAILKSSEASALKELKRLEEEYRLDVDPQAVIESLPVGLQQRVAILRAMYRQAETLILDEPTGVLTPAQADDLFRVLKALRDEGKTVILITHKLREIIAITDEVSVMRRGEIVATRNTAETTVEELAELMVGRRVLLRVEKETANPGAPVIAIRDLTVVDERGVTVVDNVSFEIRAGEILGIAGVAGNGQTELLEVLSGIRHPTSGTITLNGQPIAGLNPAELRGLGLAHIPEDRHHMGLVLQFKAQENAVLGYHRDPQFGPGPFFSPKLVEQAAVGHIAKYDIRPPISTLKTANFSGGNQQKIVVAREIERDPKALLIGQPTRGVDIGAIEFIHRRIVDMRDAGKAVLVVSVELDEIRSLSDRILVMFAGRIVGEQSADATEQTLGLMMAGIAA